ncbi:hypothetical protein HYR99_27285 [Candidatus Poribacteria bacterium]|nr:hypothetical protein [Candidatus Poribacteria bacterium]
MRGKTMTHPKDFPLWQPFLQNLDETVIVLATPPKYQYGTSYNDAMAYGQLCALLQRVPPVYPADFLRENSQKNLILIGGRLTNPITQQFSLLAESRLGFEFEAGVLYDKERFAALTPTFSEGAEKMIVNTTGDYGLITYTGNPFNRETKLLGLTGIKSAGTFGAAVALSEIDVVSRMLQRMEELGANQKDLLEKTVEILVKVGAVNGVPQRGEIRVEKVRISNDAGETEKVWESEEYQLKAERPAYLLYVDAKEGGIPRIRINQTHLEFESEDRMELISLLARQAKADDEKPSGHEGWMSAMELGRRLWKEGLLIDEKWVELAPAALRRISGEIVKWARIHHITHKKDGTLVEIDSSYVADNILVDFDLNIKRVVRDLVFNINKDIKEKGILPFHFIEGGNRRGYRLNTNSACIFADS